MFSGRASLTVLGVMLCSAASAQDVLFHAVPAGGLAPAAPFEILTVGEPVVLGAAGPFRGLGFSQTIVFVPPPAFDPSPLLGRLFGACETIQVTGNAKLTGDLRANGQVSVTGKAVVDGSVYSGSIKITGQAKILGATAIVSPAVACLPIDLAPVLAALESGGPGAIPAEFLEDGALVLDGQETLTLTTGSYLLSGLRVSGGATLLTDGKVNLFVRGPIAASGQSFVNQGATTDFVVFSDSSAPVELSGGSEFSGVIYAPFAELALSGNSESRGHFFAKKIKASGKSAGVANPPGAGSLLGTGLIPGAGGAVAASVAIGGGKRKEAAQVRIPQGALKEDRRITISLERHENEEERRLKKEDMAKRGLSAASGGVVYGPEGTVFDKPVALAIAYDKENLPEGGREEELKIHHWNPLAREWEVLPDSSVDTKEKKVRASTTHFSLYAVLGASGTPASGPPAGAGAFALGEVYVFPSPAAGGVAPKFHIETGIAERVTIRVYDLAGRRVHEAELTGSPTLVDDGQGPQFAYEHAWEGRIASGVYLYAIVAEKDGARSGRTGKFVVVR